MAKQKDDRFLNFLIGFCEKCGCDLVIRDKKGGEVFSFRQKKSELSYQGKVGEGAGAWIFETNSKEILPDLENLLSEKLEFERVKRENERKEKIIYSLESVSEGMNTIYDLKSILQIILDTAFKITQAHTGAILLLGEDGYLDLMVATGKDQDLVNKIRLKIGQGITGWTAEHAKLLNVPDVRKDNRFFKTNEEVKSELAVPLMSGETVIGVLNVDSKNIASFDKEDEILLSNLAAQAAKIIENSRLYKKASQKVSELSILFQINKAISTILDLDTLLSKIIDLVVKVMKVEHASLMLLNKDSEELEIKAAIGLEEQIIRDTKIPMGEGISGYVAKTGVPLLIKDLKNDRQFSRYYRKELKANSLLSVPLILRNEIIGVINLNNKKGGEAFNSDDCNLMETIAIQVASAIANARLYEKATEKLQELSMINSLGNRFSSSLNIEKVLSLFINEVQRIFNADRASLMLLDNEGKKLKIKQVYGIPERERKITFEIGEGVAGLSVKMKKPILVKNTNRSDEYKKFFPDGGEYSLITVPLIFKNKILGVINLERDLSHFQAFSQENLELLTTIAYQGANALENANLYTELINLYLTTIQSLAAAIDAKDPYTHGHSKRVAEYAVAISRKIGCTLEELEVIKHTALLHDIGKIGVPEKILMKPGKLTREEFEEIKKHPVLGTEIIKSIKFLEEVSLFLKHHHERFDGKGYPDSLAGEDIPLGSRIISIADTFDAMTSDRPYRKSCSRERAMEELKTCAGHQFDPILVDAFISVLSEEHLDFSKHQAKRIAVG
ncbi:MAG: GAF domain-containing protein [Candidatus Wallbacteria bacterium]|nr:GAF domain-containing protein [Candidatus Wallbacteria bacterium]